MSQITTRRFPGLARLALIKGALLLVCMLIPMIAGADRLVVDMKDGTSNTFDNVIIHSAELDADNHLVLNVKPSPDAATYPVELSRVISLEIGDNGEGRTYHLATPTQVGGRRVYENVTILGYKDGEFQLIPENRTQAFPLKGTAVITMQPGESKGNHPAFDAAPLPDTYKNYQESNLGYDRNNLPGAEMNPSGDWNEGVAGYDTISEDGDASDTGSSEMPDELSRILDSILNDGGSEEISIAGMILSGGIFILFLGTWIWCLIHAITDESESRWVRILVLICCCCCSLTKVWYAFSQYEGKGKSLLRVLVVVEFLLGLMYRFSGYF
ncbi:hypothetical protein KQI84_15360 [bacterium]|nr:hypothetical protein [bacterium]